MPSNTAPQWYPHYFGPRVLLGCALLAAACGARSQIRVAPSVAPATTAESRARDAGPVCPPLVAHCDGAAQPADCKLRKTALPGEPEPSSRVVRLRLSNELADHNEVSAAILGLVPAFARCFQEGSRVTHQAAGHLGLHMDLAPQCVRQFAVRRSDLDPETLECVKATLSSLFERDQSRSAIDVVLSFSTMGAPAEGLVKD